MCIPYNRITGRHYSYIRVYHNIGDHGIMENIRSPCNISTCISKGQKAYVIMIPILPIYVWYGAVW